MEQGAKKGGFCSSVFEFARGLMGVSRWVDKVFLRVDRVGFEREIRTVQSIEGWVSAGLELGGALECLQG